MASIVIAGDTSGAVTIAAPATAGTPTLTLPTTSGTLVVTGGAQTVQFAAGSAAAPSITFTGDTNTGIFSPAADSIAFTEGGVESMRIDASGNVGIGTSSPQHKLDIAGSGMTLSRIRGGTSAGQGAGYFVVNSTGTSSLIGLCDDSTINGGTPEVNMSIFSTRPLLFYTNSAERMRIDSNGSVGIGTSDFGSFGSAILRVRQDSNSTSAVAGMYLRNGSFTSGTQTGIGFLNADNFNAKIYSFRNPSSEGNIVFAINNGNGTAESNVVERMRITSGGVLQVGNNNGTGEVFAQNTVKVWGAISAGPGTFYNSFGTSSISKTSTGVFQVNFSRTLASSRFGMGGAGYGSAVYVAGGGESTTGTQVRIYNSSGTLIDSDIQFLIAGGS